MAKEEVAPVLCVRCPHHEHGTGPCSNWDAKHGLCVCHGVGCPACAESRCHTPEEWKNHPLAGHGYTPETGWTFPQELNELYQWIRDAFHYDFPNIQGRFERMKTIIK